MEEAAFEEAQDGLAARPVTMERYRELLRAFDATVCEALAVGQATSGRMAEPHVGYGTHIFARICGHAVSFVRAAPHSRWVKSDSENWDFSAIAGHARSIVEGYLFFAYMTHPPANAEELNARVNVMHLYDCTKRIRVLGGVVDKTMLEDFEKSAEEIRKRLKQNGWFSQLKDTLQEKLLKGGELTILSRPEQLELVEWKAREFYMFWDILSQYAHILTFSFYRMEHNGRGTGINNDADRFYIGLFLEHCAEVLSDCVDRMIVLFPDAAPVRKGIDSKFSPGPRRNLPRERKRKRR
ncbi:hypothetical protein NKI39_19185 [Mesorhizobium sp. M0664]|uniref:hypothetical protein n=1 Tax=Mesorhizobium sp. M0664 TaxID=2956982 RepID=UPI00333D0FDF